MSAGRKALIHTFSDTTLPPKGGVEPAPGVSHTLTHSHTHTPTHSHTLSHTLTHSHTLSHTLTHSHTLSHTPNTGGVAPATGGGAAESDFTNALLK